MGRPAVIYGATGLVGQQLLDMLLAADRYERIYAITRRKLERSHARLENIVLSGDKLGQWTPPLGGADAFCAIGTTIKQAGSRAAFRQVDYDFSLAFARAAFGLGVEHFLLVSALGADPASPIFYSKVKGELERDVAALGFRRLTIIRPSLLLGKRAKLRPGEALAGLFSPFMRGPLKPYAPIEASQVAQAMLLLAAEKRDEKVQIIPSEELKRICKLA